MLDFPRTSNTNKSAPTHRILDRLRTSRKLEKTPLGGIDAYILLRSESRAEVPTAYCPHMEFCVTMHGRQL